MTRNVFELTSRFAVLPPSLPQLLLLCSFASELASSHPSSPPGLGVAEEGREGGREGEEEEESKKVRIKKLEVLQQTLGKI